MQLEDKLDVQENHWMLKVIWVLLQLPVLTVSEVPTVASPAMLGRDVFVGAAAA